MQKTATWFATAWAALVPGLVAAATPASSAAAPRHLALAGPAPQGEARTVTVLVGRSQHFTVPWATKGASLTDAAVADVQVLTPQLLLVTGKSVGVTNLLVWSEKGETLEAKIEVNADLSRLNSDVSAMFPSAGLKLTQSQSVVLVSGTFERAEQAQQLHKYLDALKVSFVDMTSLAGVQQVQVQVRMAEVNRESLRALGVNGIVGGSDAFFGSNLGASQQSGIAPPVGAAATGNNPFQFGPTNMSPAVTLFGGLTRGDLEVFVQALAENRYLRILAEPNLVALSGSEASFLAGGEVPIPVVQGGTGGAAASITIQFKPFGIGLKFRPTVLGNGGIRLEIASEVSEIGERSVKIGPIETNDFLTRKAETTLELKSGQSFAMAGLLSERTKGGSSRIPGLGDLPVLGALFRSVNYSKGETELLVLVTASLVEPLSMATVPPMPGDSDASPSDWELYAEGRLWGERSSSGASFSDQKWMQEMGLDGLKGPGAWMSYGQSPAVSMARPGHPIPIVQTVQLESPVSQEPRQ